MKTPDDNKQNHWRKESPLWCYSMIF